MREANWIPEDATNRDVHYVRFFTFGVSERMFWRECGDVPRVIGKLRYLCRMACSRGETSDRHFPDSRNCWWQPFRIALTGAYGRALALDAAASGEWRVASGE